MRVSIDVDVEDLLDELSDEQLRRECARRQIRTDGGESFKDRLQRVFNEMRGGNISESLRDLFDDVLGRIAA